MTQTWNPANMTGGAALSNGNLTATQTAGSTADALVFGTENFSSGKFYWELAIGSGSNVAAGVANSGAIPNTGYLGQNSAGLGWFNTGSVLSNGLTPATWATYTTGARLGLALDFTNGKIWGRPGIASNWNNDVIGNQNPATNTGGLTLPAGVAGAALIPAIEVADPSNAITAAFLAASWTGTPPAGFGAFDPVAGSGLGNALLLGVGGSIVRRDFRPIRALLGARRK